MRFQEKIIILFGSILIIYNFAVAFDSETIKIHPFILSAKYCINCHKNKEKEIKDTAMSCAPLCFTCHKDMKNHHTINTKIAEGLPDEFILTAKKRITCVTCHNLKAERYDTSSWKSISLYEKIFKDTSKHKTYYLVKKNNSGQLCKTCH